MSATRQRTGDIDVAALEIPREEAIHGKHSLQCALELVNRTRAMLLPGPQADQLDHASRQICVGITVLRDADRTGNEICSTAGIPDLGEKALQRRTLKPKASSRRTSP